MKILIVTDAWIPQVNGVVRTLETIADRLVELGHQVDVIGPERFRTVAMPTYAEIRLAVLPGRRLTRMIDDLKPDAIHIATEGPLGWAARAYCRRRKFAFTTSYHTRFPEYLAERFPIPLSWSYRQLRRFHDPAARILINTTTMEQALAAWGFVDMVRWCRGVDTELFHPQDKSELSFPRPISMYVGRVAPEKNIDAFLGLDLPGTKVVVGDGPSRADLAKRFPDAQFVGVKHGADLARHYAAADVFVFPSRTDTFGLVMLEALACGVPVAAFPVPGPLDVIGDAPVGGLHDDLGKAIELALTRSPEDCRAYALQFSWTQSAHEFVAHLALIDWPGAERRAA